MGSSNALCDKVVYNETHHYKVYRMLSIKDADRILYKYKYLYSVDKNYSTYAPC